MFASCLRQAPLQEGLLLTSLTGLDWSLISGLILKAVDATMKHSTLDHLQAIEHDLITASVRHIL